MNKKIIGQALLTLVLVIFTVYSALAASADCTDSLCLDSYWSENEETFITAEAGQDLDLLVEVLSGYPFSFWADLESVDGSFERNEIKKHTPIVLDFRETFTISTTDLPAGDYTLKIYAANTDTNNNQNHKSKTLLLHLTAPAPEPVDQNEAPYFRFLLEADDYDFGATYAFDEDETVLIMVDGRDADKDDLTFNVLAVQKSLPDGLTAKAVYNGAQQNDLFIVGKTSQTGVYHFDVTVTDGKESYTAPLTVVIGTPIQPGSNEAPTFRFLPTADDYDFGATYAFDVSETVLIMVDGRDADKDYLTYNLLAVQKALPDGLTAKFVPNGAQQNDLFITGIAKRAGTYHFDITVTDGKESYTAPLTIVINDEVPAEGDNTAPIVNEIADQNVAENEELQFTVTAKDADHDALTYEIEVRQKLFLIFNSFQNELLSGMTFDEQTGEFTFTPGYEFVQHPSLEKNVNIRVRAYDGKQYSSWKVATVTVEDVNRIPAITATQIPVVVSANQITQFTATATDADQDRLTYAWNFGDGSTSVLQNAPHAYLAVGHYTVTIAVRDNYGGLTTITKTVEVVSEPVNNEVCTDGIDNDQDGFIDCQDADCAAAPACQAGTEICYNGLDDDQDGLVDCADADCNAYPDCQIAPFEDILDQRLKIKTVHLSTEQVRGGELLAINVNVANNGQVDLENLRVIALFPELNERISSSKFDLDQKHSHNELVYLLVPEGYQTGDYLLQITVGNDHYHDSAYRQITLVE